MTVEDLVKEFNTTPFLFIGSGITRRYLGLPDWKGLLDHFVKEFKDDDFAYASYESRANATEHPYGIMPKIAELIQRDYDEKWFEDSMIRHIKGEDLNRVKAGVSPFKMEIAEYIRSIGQINEQYLDEIKMLVNISKKSITGVITTNYDSFIENHFEGYTQFIGQNQLIFSAIQGIAEIYKIHGSVDDPKSIVINEEDYRQFAEKSKYLAAKLMTIFMEYPIIFMGYSISDSNIRDIISSIAEVLDEIQLKTLENRFVFVEYKEDMTGVEISPYTIVINNNSLNMTKVTLSDYMILYKALENKKSKLPVKILRRFKEELYTYTLTSVPTSNIRVAGIEDNRVDDDDLVIALVKPGEIGLRGLSGITGNEWYTDIVMGTLDFSADDMLTHAYPKLISQNSNKLPVFKYLKKAKGEFADLKSTVSIQTFESLISNTNKKQRKNMHNMTIKSIWESNATEKKKIRQIGCLEESQIDVDYLEKILVDIFRQDMNFLDHADPSIRSSYKLLIRIYDYMKWAK